MRAIVRRLAIGLAALGIVAARAEDEASIVVFTSLPTLYSITSALTVGTTIEVKNLPEGGRPLAAQPSFFGAQAERLAAELARADAVVTAAKLWRDDPLYTAARAANLRVVDIDATKPWSTTLEGVQIALAPADDAPWIEHASDPPRDPSVHFWLSPSNGVRSAEIVAADLMRLAPAEAPAIAVNLGAFRRRVLELKRDYEIKLAALADVTVYALAGELVYLTNDMSIYVDGYFLKPDIQWTEADATSFSRHLDEREIGVVIHRYEPAEPIRAAIDAAGARLVVLEPGDTGIVEEGRLVRDGYERLLRANLEALSGALLEANR
jgi:ABC-type Zn uptake system ZnuABC Zn-binding protein ZnuA